MRHRKRERENHAFRLAVKDKGVGNVALLVLVVSECEESSIVSIPPFPFQISIDIEEIYTYIAREGAEPGNAVYDRPYRPPTKLPTREDDRDVAPTKGEGGENDAE